MTGYSMKYIYFMTFAVRIGEKRFFAHISKTVTPTASET